MKKKSNKPLEGRIALVTGVSRRKGIGFAIASRLAQDGADLFIQSYSPYDESSPWGAEPNGIDSILTELKNHGHRVEHIEANFNDPEAPRRVVEKAFQTFLNIDILITSHAYWLEGKLEDLTAENIDTHMNVNVRATLLLIKEWSIRHDDNRPGGRVIMMTSGQHLSPMCDELSYVASKGALHQLTQSMSYALIKRGIMVNTVNPGATDTVDYQRHYPEVYQAVLNKEPQGRWGQPEDAARLITWLVSDEAQWISGQVINSDGGVHF